METTRNTLFVDNPLPSVHRRVTTRRSPYLNCFYAHFPVRVCLDTGAESSLVSERFAKYVDLHIEPATQGAVQADVKHH